MNKKQNSSLPFISILLLVTIVAVVGLALVSGTNPPVSHVNYYPLAVGNKWEFTMLPEVKTYDETVSQKTTIGTNAAYAVTIDDDYSYMGKIGGSVYQFGQGEPGSPKNMAEFNPPQLVYPTPFEIGGTWNTPVPSEALIKDSPTEFVSGTVDLKEDLTVPAGTFKDCVKVTVDDPRDSPSEMTDIWFAPNIGIVKTITYTVIGHRPPIITSTLLTKYHVLPNSE